MNDAHPEPADIAALDEDLLAPDEAARLRDHLVRCSACAGVRDDLAALRQALNELPAPGPIPDDVAARIDAAIAAEAPPATAAVSRETVPQQRALRDRRQRRMRLGLAAVGALVFLGIGGTLLSSIDGGTGDDSATSAESAAGHDQQPNDGGAGEPLESQVRELLAATESNNPLLDDGNEESDAATPEQPSPTPATMAALPACVEAAIGRAESPLAAEEEDYAGVDAYLVVLPHAADPERVDAYVVAATCASASPEASGEILVRESYPRE